MKELNPLTLLRALDASAKSDLQHLGVNQSSRFSSIYSLQAPEELWAGIDLRYFWQRSQIEYCFGETAIFLRDLHVDSLGSHSIPFRLVKLVPYWRIRQVLRLESDTLLIRLPCLPTGRLLFNAGRLKRLWDSGRHLTDKRLQKLWRYLNPTGPFRSLLRKIVHANVQRLIQDITVLRKKSLSDADLFSGVIDLIEINIDKSSRSQHAQDQSVMDQALGMVKKDDRQKLDRLLTAWQKQLDDPRLEESVGEAMFMAHKNTESKDLKVRQRVFSLIAAVTNVHDISVDIQLSDTRLVPYVTDTPIRADIDAVVFAPFVATSTLDLINIDLNAQKQSNKLMQTATLDWAINQINVSSAD